MVISRIICSLGKCRAPVHGSVRFLAASAEYNPASMLAPVSDSMLVSLSLQHGLDNAKDSLKWLIDGGHLSNPRIRSAWESVDRSLFRTTTSPLVHAQALHSCEHLLRPGHAMLDVGCGSAIMAAYCSKLGMDAIGIDCQQNAVDQARSCVASLHLPVQVFQSDCSDWPIESLTNRQFDLIYFGFAVPILPEYWLELLASNGRLMVPIGNANCEQVLTIYDKDPEGSLRITKDTSTCSYQSIIFKEETTSNSRIKVSKSNLGAQLQQWRNTFIDRHKRRPSLQDMQNDPLVINILQQLK